MVFSLLRRARRAIAETERTSGEPRSDNGASSLHLIWTLPQTALREVEATLEILEPPAARRLYFWALQVSFGSDRRLQGSAHIGLQWNPRHAGSTAANWGGYGPPTPRRQMLRGVSPADSGVPDDQNTRDYSWTPGHRYRLHVAPGGEAPPGMHAWRGLVTDLESGEATVLRDLFSEGDELLAPMVWSEVFARCEHPPTTVRWSDFRAVSVSGNEIRPRSVRVNYQSRTDGGCDNTTASVDELGILQTTCTRRQVPQGAMLPVPA